MRKLTLLAAALFAVSMSFAQNSFTGQIDPHEIRFMTDKPADLTRQQQMRALPQWTSFVNTHGTWYAHFNENSGMPHRAYGKPLSIAGGDEVQKTLHFAEQELAAFHIPLAELGEATVKKTNKYTYVRSRQFHEGLEVLYSSYMTKFFEGKLVMFSLDVHPAITVQTNPSISLSQAEAAAQAGINNTILSVSGSDILAILPVPAGGQYAYHLIYQVMVNTRDAEGVPANYLTYVDAHSGEIIARSNQVKHVDGGPCRNHGYHHPVKGSCAQAGSLLEITTTVTGEVYENSPYESTVIQDLENIYVTVGGTDYLSDQSGSATIPVNPGSTATVRMMGPWSRVYSNGVTPSTTATLVDGPNTISFNSSSNIRERTAYRSVQKIHDHHRLWMPADFTGMDYQLPTNVDVAGTCNAFYDGASINFYATGGGCNAAALVADVAYHEYGHGINDEFYTWNGSFFNNGAMGEAYADFWALSLTNSPQLGVGFNTTDLEPIRRYDQDPKVYPSDISGEVHSDGEILMGAWWDTHLLMGADWNITIPLFVETYFGLQAEAANGNEGEAYTDVLLDLLMADDDDGDITNGTPNGDAIVEGFYIHGITLISNATLTHTPILFSSADQPLDLEVMLTLEFPFTQYLQDVKCFYKINNGPWNETDMVNDGEDNYNYLVSGLENGDVLAHYFGAHDVNGSVGAVLPIGAHLDPFPNLPYYTLVGVVVHGVHDSDDSADFGNWQTGMPNDDATTGEWIEDSPVGSQTTDAAAGTIVQVYNNHTPGGEVCFITGNASSETAGIGENDVDGGKTTLQTPTIDMSNLNEPVVAYWRYYTNSPPGGANPGMDYWQVRISNDGGVNWTYIENNRTSDMSWRRHAFKVSDYVEPTAQMRMQFIASDSTFVGMNLDGGSLVEAALDDFVIYEKLIIGVEENDEAASTLHIFPVPAKDEISLVSGLGYSGTVNIRMINSEGRVVYQTQRNSLAKGQQLQLDLPELADGYYSIVLESRTTTETARVLIQK